MSAKKIDGILLSKQIKQKVITAITNSKNLKPKLAVVLIGEDPASQIYVANKQKACDECLIESVSIKQPSSITQSQLEDIITTLNNDNSIHGILVQLPLPKHIDKQKIINLINPAKDVDGFCTANIGKIFDDYTIEEMLFSSLLPCTPKGCLYAISSLLKDQDPTKPLAGFNTCIVGASNIVGRPLANMLITLGATVSICNSKTQDLSFYTKNADIVIAAAGRPNLITKDILKQDCIVVDVGINRVFDEQTQKNKVVGDVSSNCIEVASYITPVPGGIGPLTISFLMYNTLQACLNSVNNK